MNAHFDDEAGIIRRTAASISASPTQTPAGLMVPVVRHAEARDLWDCAAELDRAGRRAHGRAPRRATSSPARPSPSPRSARWAASPRRRSSTTRRSRSSASTRSMVRPVWDGAPFVPRKMMNLSSQLRSPRHRRLGRRRLRPAHQGAARDARADLRGGREAMADIDLQAARHRRRPRRLCLRHPRRPARPRHGHRRGATGSAAPASMSAASRPRR